MRRATVIVSATVVLMAGGAWAVATGGSSSGASDGLTPQATGVIRATRFYARGPTATYDFDYGSIGTVSPLRLTFPAGSTYDVLVTISLDYRTSPKDASVIGLSVRRDSEFGHLVSGVPAVRAISASTVRTSTTAVFRLSDLRGGREYWFSPNVNVSHRVGDRASIGSNHVLLVVEAMPSA